MRPGRPWASAAGLLVGLAAVAALVPGFRVEAGEGSLGLDLRVALRVPGELALARKDPQVVNARRMLPGSTVQGGATVRNMTGVALDVRVAAVPSARELLRTLRVEVLADGRRIGRGTLAEMRSWRRTRFVLPRGRSARLRVKATLPRTVRRGYQGHLEDLALDLRATAVGKAGG